MNAHERKVLKRMAEKMASTIVAEQCGHSTAQKDSQAKKEDKKESDKVPDHAKSRTARALAIAKQILGVSKTTIGFLLAILGLLTGYLSLLQHISVSRNEQLDQNDTFSSPFIVSNDGPLPIENVRFRCGLGRTTYDKGKGPPEVIGGENFGSSFIFMPDATGRLPMQNFGSSEMNPGERSTIPSCAYPFPKDISGGDIGIVVDFRIGYTPFAGKRIFRFRTLADANGKLHWFPFPLK
jgi:hypothetical protein